jgi:uncharacterized damage-inducible protein DinB
MHHPTLTLLLGYHTSRNAKLWDAIEALGEAAFAAPATYSLGSIRNHMVHLGSVDGAWHNGLIGQPREAFSWLALEEYPTVYPTIASARAFQTSMTQRVVDALAGWSEADLAVVPANMRETRWQIITHLVTHGVDHRAQVLRLIADLGGQTFPQDLIMYVWEQQSEKN